MMSQVVIGEQCDCPEDCDSVTYTKFETSKDLNAEELCSDTTSWVYKHMKNTKRNVEGHAYRLILSLMIICFQVMAIQPVVVFSSYAECKMVDISAAAPATGDTLSGVSGPGLHGLHSM